MQFIMRKIFLTIVVLVLSLGYCHTVPVHAMNAISLTALDVAYTQDFDTLSNTTESATLPSGWFLFETGTAANALYNVDSGISNVGDTYSYGSLGSSDRALGGIQSPNLLPLFGAAFTNNTGGTIESLEISYRGEQWRVGKTGRKDKIIFEISIDATSLHDGIWYEQENLTYLSNSNSSVGAKNGNSPTYQQDLTGVISELTDSGGVITSISISEGETFWIRWTDFDAVNGADDGLAVDDFSITPGGTDFAPLVTEILPADNALTVIRDAPVSISFSELVNLEQEGVSINCSISGQHAVTFSGGPDTFLINHANDFEYGEICEIIVSADKVFDLDTSDPPEGMFTDFVSHFTVQSEPDSPPTVTGISPVNNETSVALNSSLTVRFSEPVSLAPGWFTLECSSSGEHAVEVMGDSIEFTLTPQVYFTYDETCTLTINAEYVDDLDADGSDVMPASLISTFTTLASPDTAPFIVESFPVNNGSDISIDQNILITFNEPVSIEEGAFQLDCSQTGPHSLQVSGGTTVFTINPDNDFVYDENCTLLVNSQKVTDLDLTSLPDHMMMDQTITFTTIDPPDIAPLITSSTPAINADSVLVDSDITLYFNEPVTTTGNWFTLSCSISGDHSATFSVETQAIVIDPEMDFAFTETCTLLIKGAQISDMDVNGLSEYMEADFILTFSTLASSDLPPIVIATFPENNAIDGPISGNLTITFSESVYLRSGWINFSCEQSGTHTIFLSGGPIEFSIGSDRNFSYQETCTVNLISEYIDDLDDDDPPDSMESDYSFSFTTIADPDALTYPVIVAGANTNPSDGVTLGAGIHQLMIQFSKTVLHNGSRDAADNPNNYRLIAGGKNNRPETDTCEEVSGDDLLVSIDGIQYDPSTNTATLFINQGANLTNGNYRLVICGAHTIRDLHGNPINNGENSFINFTITIPDSGGGSGNSGGDNEPSSNSSAPKTGTSKYGPLIPVTGFTPDQITLLPNQSVAYSELGNLWLEIPELEAKMSIIGVPQADGQWDVTWLGDQAGWLEGSAFPTLEGNSVLTAHVWDALNQPGPFFGLEKLQYGDEVIVHAWGEEYVYEVREVLSVSPKNVNAMLKHQESPWLTLVTCQGYDEDSGTYMRRILVRAVLVEIIGDQEK